MHGRERERDILWLLERMWGSVWIYQLIIIIMNNVIII